MLELIRTSTYKKHLKKYKHQKEVLKELNKVIDILVKEEQMPSKYKNHKLIGNYNGMMELHLRPDDLLIYYEIKSKCAVAKLH
jgi:mRNA interferase YafQ